MLLTPENIHEAMQALGAHRGRSDAPDERIVRKILMAFQDVESFRLWVSGLAAGLDPSQITGDGYGIYLSDAQRWIENRGRRAPKRMTARKTTASPYFDPSSITGRPWPASTAECTMDPETKRRIRDAKVKRDDSAA